MKSLAYVAILTTLLFSINAFAKTDVLIKPGNSNISGKEFCDAYIQMPTCIPAYNNSAITLIMNNREVPPQYVYVMVSQSEVPEKNIAVVNSENQKTIFNGAVKNQVGVVCSDNACDEWK